MQSPADQPAPRWTPLTVAAVTVTLGVAAGLAAPSGATPAAWSTAAVLALVLAPAPRRRPRLTLALALVALAAAAAAWAALHDRYTSPNDLRLTITDEPRLARIEGVVAGAPYHASPHRGALGQFAFEKPSTLLVLRATRAHTPDGWRRASGRVLVSYEGVDERLHAGDRACAVGWLGPLTPTANPGEFDYAAWAARQGIGGRLSAKSPHNIEPLPPDGTLLPAVHRARAAVAAAAHRSLELGLGQQRVPLALLEALLLGRRDALPRSLSDAFRETGMAHLLSISGAHLSILVGLVWLVTALLVQRPGRAALIVATVLLAYLVAVPLEVPLLRSALMALCFLAAWALGRRFRGLDALAAATLLCLLGRPADLADAGFQLSFGIVAALLLFTPRVAALLTPAAAVPQHGPPTVGQRAAQFLAAYLAVSIVAFLVALPLGAYHFGMITPLAVLLSVLALPFVTAVLALGYLKIVAGLLLPSAGLLLAGPLAWLAQVMILLTEGAADWPGASVQLQHNPGPLWATAALAALVALLAGRFRGPRGRVAGAAALGLCALWLGLAGWSWPPPAPAALRVNMFAVGDGSCFLVRAGGKALLFDCGSQSYLDVGLKSVGPALRHLGVRHLDLVILSHPDFDHYNGVLDVLSFASADRVLITGQFAAQAAATPRGPERFVLDDLHRRGVPVELVQRGWSHALGPLQLAALWPPPPDDYTGPRDNDESLVLRVAHGPRVLLLHGDAAQDALTRLLDRGADLRAHVMDLPHHGAFVDASPAHLAAAAPRLVLQSSDRRRLDADAWAPLLAQRGIPRLTTAELGMVELTLPPDGPLQWTRHRPPAPPAPTTP